MKIDLTLGYHKPRVRGVDIPKTTLKTTFGHYKFLVISLGLTMSPATFMNLMNREFQNYLHSFVIIIIDDTLEYSKIKDEHVSHLRVVLQVFKDIQHFVEYIKCEFWLTFSAFLCHISSSMGIGINLKKTEVVKNFLRPLSDIDIQSFLALSRYYRIFIDGFASITSPLTTLTQMKVNFEWTEA